MIAVVCIGLAAAVILMQFFAAPRALRQLHYEYSFDTALAEPDEKIAYTGKLSNNGFLPVSYITLASLLPEGAVITGRKTNRDAHRLFLLPHRSSRHSLTFSLPGRGVYRGGRYYLETGDFLGFKSRVISERIAAEIIVMPRKCEDESVVKTLGGYIGDISVRRFIIEDPMLTVGYREYTGREPMKKISWPQSARTGKLMVKNSDYTVDINVAVVLNMASGSAGEKEKSLEIVRTVCEQLEEKRIPYQFFSNGDIGELEEGLGRKHLNALMRELGRSGLFSYYSFDSLIERCIRERKRGRSYILITPPLSDENRAELARLSAGSDHEPCILEAEVE